MIRIDKLAKLSSRHRMRKMALVLGEIERDLLANRGDGTADPAVLRYGVELAELLLSDKIDSEAVRRGRSHFQDFAPYHRRRRSCRAPLGHATTSRGRSDSLRHALIVATGQAPADWDLVDPNTGLPDRGARKVFPGRRVYLEDLRLPFNVGSVFRTADAFGVEEIILSPSCADPLHPRALRSAMGAIELLPWSRAELESLEGDVPVFALELGGEPIHSFSFRKKE